MTDHQPCLVLNLLLRLEIMEATAFAMSLLVDLRCLASTVAFQVGPPMYVETIVDTNRLRPGFGVRRSLD